MIPGPDIEMAVFETARLIENPQERDAFLDWIFRDSPHDGADMRELLAAEGESRTWFQSARSTRRRLAGEIMEIGRVELPQSTGEDIESIGLPRSIAGRFQIIRRLGGGSGGVVFLADQVEPIRRPVAIKVLRVGMDTPAFLAAFQRESQALALMNHPNIAGILDAGTTESGRSYFVMELVEGERITKFCDERRYTLHRRLGLFLQVCSAIQHAHQKGVIHGDIKPSNVLVSDGGGHDLPKVLDFGISLSITEISSGEADRLFAGTPAYMSPEQVGASNSDIDTRTDVFSLGVLLYELLAGDLPWSPGAMPHSRNTLMPSEQLTRVDSEKLATLANQRQSRPARLIASLRGDLDSIIRTATAEDRQQRYETVNSLIAEIQRHLSDLPVYAHPPGRLYFTQKFVARNRLIVLSGMTVFIILLLATGLAFQAFLSEREALRETKLARAKESELRRQVQAREIVGKAAILLSQNLILEADALLLDTPISSIKPSAEATSVLRFLGERNAILGRWKEASECFVGLMESNQLEPPEKTAVGMDLLLAAPSLLEYGDETAYHRIRLDMLRRFASTQHPIAAEHMVKMCLLRPAPPAILRDLEPMALLLQKTLDHPNPEQGSFSGWNAMALALYDYRRLDFKKALTQSEKCQSYPENRPSRVAGVKLVSAMAFHHLGQNEDAQRELASASRLIAEATPNEVVNHAVTYNPGTETWYAWAVARILSREAIATLGSHSSAKNPDFSDSRK